MDLIQSILLWSAGLVSLIMIMFYVLRSPRTPQRPELGLGKRYPIQAVKRPKRTRAIAANGPEFQPTVMPEQYGQAQQNASQQLTAAQYLAPDPEYRQDFQTGGNFKQEELQAGRAESSDEKIRKPKRGDTLQFMLNKAIAERK